MPRGNQHRKDEVLICALLTTPTLALAAQKAGVSERTVNNRLADPEFDANFRAVRRRVLEGVTIAYERAYAAGAALLEEIVADTSRSDAVRLAAVRLVNARFHADGGEDVSLEIEEAILEIKQHFNKRREGYS
jgi:hypothetical protein